MHRPALSSLVLAAAILCGCSAAARGDLVCAQPTVQLPECRAGIPLVHRFVFRCSGPDDVEILEVKPGCGCLTPRVQKRHYRPGELGEIALEINTLTQPAGPHGWRATLFYRDGDRQKEMILQIASTVVAELQLEPATLILNTDSTVRHQLTLTERRPLPINMLQVQATRPGLRVSVEPAQQVAPKEWRRAISVEVAESFPQGRFEEVIQLVSDDEEYRELKVPVTVVKRPRGEVTAVPSQIEFRSRRGAPAPSRLVLLSARDDREVQVERVEADDPVVQCRWTPGPGASATLRISLDPGQAPAGEQDTAVTISLRAPTAERLRIPVSIRPAP